ncbi:uncharacterized protein BX664DRAFT_342547 [Halteromyces radiatus]|uniref:uncharacterized protein n=1 Tax=Halteromyces radiatus TaxID=101107 RepID=UPI002220B613|nr:uncharacterized protein BX664DRAFT_342547 [Halteromyces radiatus]KAI8078719.1 hypothetical protein BX664DRAFT_342547 [Halteromyces radiatus]
MSQPDYSNMRKIVTGDIVIKCRFGKDIRRLTINQAPTYDELCLMMCRIFKLPNTEDITLKYTDNENDLISLIDDNDITHAISQSNLLKVTILDKASLDTVAPGVLPEDLRLQLTSLRDSLDSILRYVPDTKSGGSQAPQPAIDPKYKPLSSAELDESNGPRSNLASKGSTDALSTSSNGETGKQTPTIKNNMYLPPGTPKQMPMKSPGLQSMHQSGQYGQRPSPLNYPSYGPPQGSPSAPATPQSGFQPNNVNNKLAGPFMNTRPPPPPMQQQGQRQQNGYIVPGTPLSQHQIPLHPPQQRPPPPQQQQSTSTPPPPQQLQSQPQVQGQPQPQPPLQQQQQQQQQPQQAQQPQQVSQLPPQGSVQQQPAPSSQIAPQNQPPVQQVPQQVPQQQQQPYYYQPNNGQQPPPPQTPQQNYRPAPGPGNRW